VQNIAEGSMASGTSRKTELKLTNVARASLEELRLDYEDFLRQRGLALWPRDDPRRKALVERRCTNADQVAEWIREIARREGARRQRDGHYGQDGQAGAAPESMESIRSIQSKPPLNPALPPFRHAAYAELSANAALVLIGVTTALLDRQLDAQARAFEQEGGFTERLYLVRSESRRMR
jgi:four helix bundle suffix protein